MFYKTINHTNPLSNTYIKLNRDGNVSLVEFVKIVSNIGNASAAEQTNLSQEQQEEQELRDAFRRTGEKYFSLYGDNGVNKKHTKKIQWIKHKKEL
ncbi:hypothetical protein PV326_011219 [Microctonus aethiopoides]|nr:hypothetical protein PV326_011219 [Microctonus aethiopoides]